MHDCKSQRRHSRLDSVACLTPTQGGITAINARVYAVKVVQIPELLAQDIFSFKYIAGASQPTPRRSTRDLQGEHWRYISTHQLIVGAAQSTFDTCISGDWIRVCTEEG